MGPLQKQLELLTAEPSLQLHTRLKTHPHCPPPSWYVSCFEYWSWVPPCNNQVGFSSQDISLRGPQSPTVPHTTAPSRDLGQAPPSYTQTSHVDNSITQSALPASGTHPLGALPVPPLGATTARCPCLYATNFRRDPPIAGLWRRSNGKAMPRHCSAAGCCTRDTRETRNRGISFHSGYHRLKEGAVPTIFESFSKLRRTAKTKGHGYPPGLPDVSRLRRCRKRCSEGQGPTTPFSSPPPPDVICFPVEEASAPATLPASPAVRLEPGLSNPFSDLLDPLGAQADEAGCSAQPSPERQPSPLEPRPVSPSAYMLRLPPPAGAYIQNEHSYQVGSALLWKRRAESALDALDKAQRQLQACKRREQRLRLRLTKLQQERAREKRAQADARQTLKEHVQDFAMQLSNSMA
ncbi:THAP domain-containing protein 7 isoform X3 [Nannospalax galili]|uniref:THAP domain-containing protein 7 isoform X3 n=1 Tax=Nannospalax galili TaxID=1026970 RepID=UPI00081A04FA|nr:THAP domain-containing protein 7 isoform X3 [Nannospalax galili]